MSNDAKIVAYAAILTWVMIMGSAMIGPGGSLRLMFSNRDALPPPTPLMDRADRAAKNMIENLILFIAAYVAAKSAGAHGWKVERGAQLFIAARILYWPVYLMGITVLRTALWSVGVAGMALLVLAALTA